MSEASESTCNPQVTVDSKEPGGSSFIFLRGVPEADLELGPYENPAIAKEVADKLRKYLTGLSPATIPTAPRV